MSEQKSLVDLNELRTFYDPHPGLMGALVPIPPEVKRVAEELSGKNLTLGEALDRLRAVTTGKVELVSMSNYIGLDVMINGLRNYYRVIRYR